MSTGVVPSFQLSQSPKATRIRDNRAARRAWLREKHEDRAEFERRVAVRMTRRWYAGGLVPLITLDYRYWQAMRCRWNAMSPDLRRSNGVLVEPMSTPFWSWWTRLHYKSRDKFVEMSQHRLIRKPSVISDEREAPQCR